MNHQQGKIQTRPMGQVFEYSGMYHETGRNLACQPPTNKYPSRTWDVVPTVVVVVPHSNSPFRGDIIVQCVRRLATNKDHANHKMKKSLHIIFNDGTIRSNYE
jgi:hypothetical protein